MNMAIVNTTSITLSEGTSIKLGRKSFTLSDAIKHAVAEYDAISLLEQEFLDAVLPKWKFIGDLLNQIRSLYPSDKSGGGQFTSYVEKSDLGVMSKDQRYDAMKISANWPVVQKLNKNGDLNNLGLSAIRKRLNAEIKPKSDVGSAGNTSKGKVRGAKPEAEAEDKAESFQNEADFAAFIMSTCKSKGFDVPTLVTEMAKIRKAG